MLKSGKWVFSRKSREFPEIPGKSPENLDGKFGVFSCFQAVIVYKCIKKQYFFEPSVDEFRKIPEIPEIPGNSAGQICAISGNSGNPSRKKHVFYKIRSAQQGTLREFRGEIGTFSDIFFPEITQICKKMQKKMTKNTKNAKKNTPKNTPKFLGFFRKNTAVAICWSIKKRAENVPENPACTLRAHFFFPKFPRGAFSGVFRDFQLKIEGKISEKKAFFRRFFEKYFGFFCVLPAGGRRSHFLHEAKIRTSLFWRKKTDTIFG